MIIQVRTSILAIAAALAFASPAGAQTGARSIVQVQLDNTDTDVPQLRISLSAPIDAASLRPDAVSALSQPSGTILSAAQQQTAPRAVGGTTILVGYQKGIVPASDTAVIVNISGLKFAGDPTPAARLSGRGWVIGRNRIEWLLTRADSIISAVEPPSTTDEENVYAAFNLEAADDDETEGSADIVLNLPFDLPAVDRGFGSFKMKKGATEAGDPRHLDLSVGFRHVIFSPRVRRSLAGLRNEIATNAQSNPQVAMDALNRLQRASFLGYIVSGGTHLEADALEFSVTNFTADVAGQLAFPILTPFGRGSQLSLRVMPAGIEVGQNLGAENDSTQGTPIQRFKAGASLSLAYELFGEPGLPRLELSVQTMNRYLFRDEAHREAGTPANPIEGWRPWFEAEARFFLLDTEDYRVGVAFSYHNGGLPPTFTAARATQFGLIFQTADR
jgi:hypothetical protein